MEVTPSPVHHSLFEDMQALVTGTLMLSLGLALYRHAGLLTGGTAGIAFLLHYLSGLSFGAIFFVVNLPFYWLALRRMGRASRSRPSRRWRCCRCSPSCSRWCSASSACSRSTPR